MSDTVPFQLPPRFTIHTFASNLGNPRDMVFSPGGTLLVSSPKTGEILALPDTQNTATATNKEIVLKNLNHPHGLAFYKKNLFVATTTQVIRYDWNEKKFKATNAKVLFSLPANNDHNNPTIIVDAKGTLYVSVGSTCNVCYEVSPQSGTVLISNANGDTPRIFAKGLRNAPFLAINPLTKQLWATEMGRDYLGDTLPPDEIDILQQGRNYGWPLCYGNKIHDTQFNPSKTDPCKNTTAPIYEIPAHSAPLGLVFITSSQFPKAWQNDVLVAYHGSWNRSVPDGYKMVHLKVSGNTITKAEDFLTGFLPKNALSGKDATSRPVDLIFDKAGTLYISDDKGGNVFIMQKR